MYFETHKKAEANVSMKLSIHFAVKFNQNYVYFLFCRWLKIEINDDNYVKKKQIIYELQKKKRIKRA